MYLENLVADSVTPKKLGRFWEAALGGEQLTDEPGGYETRLAVEGCTPDDPVRHFLGWQGEVDPDELFSSGAAWGIRVVRRPV